MSLPIGRVFALGFVIRQVTWRCRVLAMPRRPCCPALRPALRSPRSISGTLLIFGPVLEEVVERPLAEPAGDEVRLIV